jgi:hypothetical protein
MGMKERRQRLQGDDEPEHQQAVKSGRHSWTRMPGMELEHASF